MKRTSELELRPFEFGTGDEPAQLLGLASSTNDDCLQHGLWECGPGQFELRFTWYETVYVLEGRAEVENLETGVKHILAPGDFATFQKGSTWRWRIPWRFRKVFTVVDRISSEGRSTDR